MSPPSPFLTVALLSLALVTAGVGCAPPAAAQPTTLTKPQSAALAAYDKALRDFRAILATRREQIDAKKPLPNLPGQAVYLARLKVMSTYKDLTDALPSRIGRPNRFGVPPAYFDADIEPLIEEYAALFRVMQAPPADAQASETPFKDVADLGRAIARAKGLDAATADAAGRISLGLFFAETNGNQNIGNARSDKYKGSLQTGVAEDRKGRAAWAALKPRITALDPAVAARDDKETARVGKGDQRFNHWTAVRNGLMNAHADLFRADPGDREDAARSDRSDEAVRADPDHPRADALRSRVGQLRGLSNFRPEDHGILAQQLHVHLRQGGPGENVRDLSRNPRCDVAVQRQVRAREGQIRRDQGSGAGPGAMTATGRCASGAHTGGMSPT